MITPDEIKMKALRAYPDYLRALVEEIFFFPFEIRFGKVSPRGNFHTFARERELLLASSRNERGRGYTVDLNPHNSRRYGTQLLPSRIYFVSEDDYLQYIGKQDEAARFKAALGRTRLDLPALLPWLAQYPHRILPFLHEWDDLLLVCRYFLSNPMPRCYARELPLPVHTKFIEEHTGILRSILDAVLPESVISTEESDFAHRFGLRIDEPLIRIRILDPDLRLRIRFPLEDLSTPLPEFQSLPLRRIRCFIVENKMTFLTLPRMVNSIGLWGGGFRVELIRRVDWLSDCELFYWGDLDAHGFMILSQLRSFFPGATSLMMDQQTLETFQPFVVPGTPTPANTLPHLSPDEHLVFNHLTRHTLRLEQERIPHAYILRYLSERGLIPDPPASL